MASTPKPRAPRAPKAPAYAVASLPTTGTQYRLASGGTGTAQQTAYQQAVRTLHAWGGGPTTANGPLVFALVHLGWCAGGGARALCKASSSAACQHGTPHLQHGKPAAPQVCATLAALAAAGAPAAALATVWATYTGKA
jgi:hypothetical protein